MNLSNWKIFNKSGSPLNWYGNPDLPLTFTKDTSSGGAEGYLITDSSSNATVAKITNSGINYITGTEVSYTYTFSDGIPVDITSDVSINYIDVSIYNPTLTVTQGIKSLSNIDISANFVYPSVTYSSAIFLTPVSQGLVETEHLYIFESVDSSLVRPYDVSTGSLIVQMVGSEDEIQLFTIDEDSQEITWTDGLEFTLDTWADATPLQLNIGFRSDEEGVYERRLRFYNIVDEKYYLMGEIMVNAESIGEDERFRALLGNFGAPDPKNIPKLFKETNINEDLPDWEILNPKSKQMVLEHAEIMPYIGTYKALINILKWLGYDDIYIREWFKNVKENKKISLVVPFDAADRTQTILKFSPTERKALKKLNQLSLNYCLTTETGEIDAWGTPETENCYEYNLKEVFIKLLALKKWLEKNIIGVNARIIDLTGEGVYYERYINLIYATTDLESNYQDYQSVTPYANPDNSELVEGDASINLSLLELSRTKIGDMSYRFSDYIDYVWNPSDPSVTLSPTDASYLADPSSYLEVGPPLTFPFVSLKDIQYKTSVEKPYSGVIPETHVSNPLWIYDNEIKYYDIFDSSCLFYDSSISLKIILEKAYLRDASNSDWANSIEYSIYPNEDSSVYSLYFMESSAGVINSFDNYVYLTQTDSSALLLYNIDKTFRVPLLSFRNYKTDDASDNIIQFQTDKFYNLDIIDGKILMDIPDTAGQEDLRLYINFNYDTSSNEQKITLNAEYISPRMPLYVIDPSIYYWADPSGLGGGTDPSILSIDNSTYKMMVNHIGDYNVEAFTYDGYNVMFYALGREPHNVWIKYPTIYSLIDDKCNNGVCSDSSISLNDASILTSQNSLPIYDRDYPYINLSLEYDPSESKYIQIPAITYHQDIPTVGSINKFYNSSEKVTSISGSNITIDNYSQSFYDEDDVTLIYTYKGNYMPIEEASSHITNILVPGLYTLDNIPSSFVIDSSHDLFILNSEDRKTTGATNNLDSSTFSINVVNYTFNVGQMVNILIDDNSTGVGHDWGASYRVIDVSGSTHTFNTTFPQFIIDNTSKYVINARHAHPLFVNYEMTTVKASESDDNFMIYDDDYREYFIDDTFVMINIMFSQDYSNNQWYSPSDNLINSEFYSYSNSIGIDISTLVILKTEYDPSIYDTSTYLLNQKNTWTIKENISKDVVFKVFNNNVPFVFDSSGYYDVISESYDEYGNLAKKTYEGLIYVN